MRKHEKDKCSNTYAIKLKVFDKSAIQNASLTLKYNIEVRPNCTLFPWAIRLQAYQTENYLYIIKRKGKS